MANNSWKDYLTFTKGERISVFILLTILLLSIFVPYFYARTFKPPVVDTVLQKQLDSVLGNIQEDSPANNLGNIQPPKNSPDSIKLFYFDPNTLDAAGFKQLGLRDKTIQTIINYRNKGGHFKRAEDIRKIYGLREDDANRIIPYIKIESNVAKTNDETTYKAEEEKPKLLIKTIDVNTATEEDFKALPGIGDMLSKRIVKFRNSINGFKSVDDIKKTYGLSDSTFQTILPYLTISGDK
jgi:competence protein ComEA